MSTDFIQPVGLLKESKVDVYHKYTYAYLFTVELYIFNIKEMIFPKFFLKNEERLKSFYAILELGPMCV